MYLIVRNFSFVTPNNQYEAYEFSLLWLRGFELKSPLHALCCVYVVMKILKLFFIIYFTNVAALLSSKFSEYWRIGPMNSKASLRVGGLMKSKPFRSQRSRLILNMASSKKATSKYRYLRALPCNGYYNQGGVYTEYIRAMRQRTSVDTEDGFVKQDRNSLPSFFLAPKKINIEECIVDEDGASCKRVILEGLFLFPCDQERRQRAD